MNNKMIPKFLLLCCGFIMLLSGCTDKQENSALADSTKLPSPKVLCSLESDGVTLSAAHLEKGEYKGLVLKGNGVTSIIDFSTSADPNYPPYLTDSSRNIEEKRNLELTLFTTAKDSEPHSLTRWYDPETLALQTVTLASADNSQFKLTAQGLEDGMYSSLRLQGKGINSALPFDIPHLPRYSLPQMVAHDWDGDGKPELAFFFAVASGTGVNIEEAHVLNPDTMQEIAVENPEQIIADHVKSSLDKDNIDIVLPDRSIHLATAEYVPADAVLNQTLGGSIVSFEVNSSGDIIARSGVDTCSTCNYIGDFIITYGFQDGVFKMKTIDFELCPEED